MKPKIVISVVALVLLLASVIAGVGCGGGGGTAANANTELHQAETAVHACMSGAEKTTLSSYNDTTGWNGSSGVIQALSVSNVTYDAADYLANKSFKAYYKVNQDGYITGVGTYTWTGITWDSNQMSWK